MPVKKIVFLTCVIFLLYSVYPLYIYGARGSSQENTVTVVPDHVFYEFYFRHIEHVLSKASKLEGQGIDSSSMRTSIKLESKLTSDQANRLIEISLNSLIAVTELDKVARQIIDEIHAQHPGGKLGINESAPEPPKTLIDLQLKRNAIFTQARENLRSFLGNESFASLDDYVKNRVKPKPIKP